MSLIVAMSRRVWVFGCLGVFGRLIGWTKTSWKVWDLGLRL
jgi:hypothetical protein